MNISDHEAYQLVASALTAVPEFEAVRVEPEAKQRRPIAPVYPVALVVPETWSEQLTDNPSIAVRMLRFRVLIAVRARLAADRIEEASRLTNQVLNQLDGSDLNGNAIPVLTKLERGQVQTSEADDVTIQELRGTLGLYIADINNR